MDGKSYGWHMLARAFAGLSSSIRQKRGFKHARAFYASRVWEGYEAAVGEMIAAPNKYAYEKGDWLYMPVHEGRGIFDYVGVKFARFIDNCDNGDIVWKAVRFVDFEAVITEAHLDNAVVKFKLKKP